LEIAMKQDLVVQVFKHPLRIWLENWTFMLDYTPTPGQDAVAVEIVKDPTTAVNVVDSEGHVLYSRVVDWDFDKLRYYAQTVDKISVMLSMEEEQPTIRSRCADTDSVIRLTLETIPGAVRTGVH